MVYVFVISPLASGDGAILTLYPPAPEVEPQPEPYYDTTGYEEEEELQQPLYDDVVEGGGGAPIYDEAVGEEEVYEPMKS